MRLVSRVKGVCRGLLSFIQMHGQHLPLGIKMVFSFRCTVIRLVGSLPGSGDAQSVLYVGRRGNYHYLVNNLFDHYEIAEEKKSTLMTFRRSMRLMEPLADVVIVDIGWPYHGRMNRNGEYLELPDWVNMAVELEDSWEGIVRSFRRTIRNNDLRYIRQNAYRCEPTTDRRAVKNFYDNMYVPFIQSRHGLDAVKSTRRHVIRRASKGCLLQIYKDEQVVAAGVVFPENGILFSLWMGMPATVIKDPPRAVVSALYYFGMRYAFDNGFWAVDFLGTRTLLTQSSFRFKRKWGALVQDTFSPSSLLIKPQSGNLNAARFCQRFPMLARRDGELEVIGLSIDEKADEETLQKLNAQYGCDGINRITLVEVSDRNDIECVDFVEDHTDYRLIRTGLNTFAEHYAKCAVDTR